MFSKKRLSKHESDEIQFSQGKIIEEKRIILAGNPNVGKSTVFNALTGLRQHTGNWSGKTVATALGTYFLGNTKYIMEDIPGCYSLKAHSKEEYCAGEAICSGSADGIIVICNASALERNLNLVLQICEAVNNVVVCINMADEYEKKGVILNYEILEKRLGVPVVKINARKKRGFEVMISKTDKSCFKNPLKVSYGRVIEQSIKTVEKALGSVKFNISKRYIALRLLENDERVIKLINKTFADNPERINAVNMVCTDAREHLHRNGITEARLNDIIATNLVRTANRICKDAIVTKPDPRTRAERTADRILTGKISGFAVMFALLMLIFFITLKGANYFSAHLSSLLMGFEEPLYSVLQRLSVPVWWCDMLVKGGYRILSWVVSVMLPPMAIFFPLFTVLEDIGYLPRVAFNLDRAFKKCKACGKQALTTCMGFGCNAAAVTGARIIDSPRERLIAILTNSFIPCNGRFPALICMITVFFTGSQSMGIVAALYLSLFVVFAIMMSLAASYLLSKTMLRGMPSSFALELPSFRRPQILQIIVRSVLNRTIFVLGRAAAVAFPAGIVLWILTNIKVNQVSLVSYLVSFLSPVGRAMGLDGTMLSAFFLGIPANEIVLPVALMIYSSESVLVSNDSFASIASILSANGWSVITALCAVIFFLMHWPCSTTLMTIKKETGSFKWTIAAFALPTLFGAVMCIAVNYISKLVCLFV